MGLTDRLHHSLPHDRCDVLVVGAGAAGLVAALHAEDTLVDEGPAWVEVLAAAGVPFGEEGGPELGQAPRLERWS